MLKINYLPGVPCPKFVITYQVPQVSSHFSSRSSVEIVLEKKFSSFYCALMKITPSVSFTHCLWPWGKRRKGNERTGIAGTYRDEVTFNLNWLSIAVLCWRSCLTHFPDFILKKWSRSHSRSSESRTNFISLIVSLTKWSNQLVLNSSYLLQLQKCPI